jgi:hypothetical protein
MYERVFAHTVRAVKAQGIIVGPEGDISATRNVALGLSFIGVNDQRRSRPGIPPLI